MPQAIAVVGAAWTALGSFTVAGLAVGTIVQGAIIGAAIGGLSSAVTGGDIGKGILFGAVGGAVIGGISGWLNPAELSVGGGPGALAGGSAGSSSASLAAAEAARNIPGQVIHQGSSGFLSGLSGEAQAAGITTLGTTLAGAFDTSKEDELALADKKLEMEAQLAREQMKSAEKIAGMKGGGGGGSQPDHSLEIAQLQRQTALDQLAEERRQYESEVQRAEAMRNRQQYAVANVRATGEPTAEEEAAAKQKSSIDQQVFQNDSLMYDQNGVLRKPEYA